MKSYLEAAGLALIAIFAPIQSAIISVFVLVCVDLATGIVAAHGRKEPISSSGIKRTVGKILLYEIAIMAAFICQSYLTGDLLPVCKLVTAMIGLVELKSVLENLGGVGENSLFKSVLGRITQEQKDQEGPKS